jgi:sugar phosphate isomerase/epimerase
MKIACCVLLSDSSVNMMAYRGKSLSETFAALREMGLDGVELLVRDPGLLDANEIKALLEKNGLTVAAVNTAPACAEDNLTLVSASAETRKLAVRRAKKIVDFAAVFGAIVSIGKFRGNLPPGERRAGWRWFKEGLTEICMYGEEKGVGIILEPQTRTNLNFLNTTQEAVQWIESSGIGNLALILDTYHMDAERERQFSSVYDARQFLRHVHIADSGRGIPGSGSIDFSELTKALKAIGYQGQLALEVSLIPDAKSAITKSCKYLSYLCNELL